MSQVRILHYLNQFFAGKGGEEKADVPVGSIEGAVGPGKRLQVLCGGSAKIIATTYCGDNYFSEHVKEVLEKVLQIAREHDVNMVVAGPAFNAGRYGFACVEICHFLSKLLGLNCVTGMFEENPGVAGYRQYKDRKVFLIPTSAELQGMEDALSRMAKLIGKLAADSTIGLPSEEGYIPRGFRVEEAVGKRGAERAIEMLLDKLAGLSFTTEIPVESFEEAPIAPAIGNLKDVNLALATTAGLVPSGNPDRLKPWHNTRWGKYSIEKLNSMKEGSWDVLHIGYSTGFMYEDPNYGLPLDVCRKLEREGLFARLYPYFYSTPGVSGGISDMEAIGREIARDMKVNGVNAALLVST